MNDIKIKKKISQEILLKKQDIYIYIYNTPLKLETRIKITLPQGHQGHAVHRG